MTCGSSVGSEKSSTTRLIRSGQATELVPSEASRADQCLPATRIGSADASSVRERRATDLVGWPRSGAASQETGGPCRHPPHLPSDAVSNRSSSRRLTHPLTTGVHSGSMFGAVGPGGQGHLSSAG